MATRYNITSTVQRVVSGNLTPGNSASALITDPNGIPITTYAAETGAGQVTNPVATSSLGRIEAWVAVPDYNIQVSGSGITTYTEYIRQTPQGTVAVEGSTSINWGTGYGVSDTNLYRSAANVLKTDDQFQAVGAVFAAFGSNSEVRIGFDGTVPDIRFGTAQDTNLYRSAANILKTDDSMRSAEGFVADTVTATTAFLSIRSSGQNVFRNLLVSSDAQPTFNITGAGIHSWGVGGSTATDTTLYRSSAGVLQTDGTFLANVLSVGSNTKAAIAVTSTSGTPGITFGGDTNLYRSSANVLATDDALTVAGTFTIAGALDHDGSTVGLFGRTPTVINATPFTNGAGMGTSQYDLPAGFTINQLAAFVMTTLKHLGDTNGIGALNTTSV